MHLERFGAAHPRVAVVLDRVEGIGEHAALPVVRESHRRAPVPPQPQLKLVAAHKPAAEAE